MRFNHDNGAYFIKNPMNACLSTCTNYVSFIGGCAVQRRHIFGEGCAVKSSHTIGMEEAHHQYKGGCAVRISRSISTEEVHLK